MKWTISDSNGLRYNTFLKVGGLYFITTNIDVSDGLFNGSTGLLKAIEFASARDESGRRVPYRVWMHFPDLRVGAHKRKTSQSIIKQRLKINNDYQLWTPIERIQRRMSKSFVCEGVQVVRSQIPLVPCNGMTIAKCQGATMETVVVSVKGTGNAKLSRAELYVACSRATSLNGLFIDGNFIPPNPAPDDDQVTAAYRKLCCNPHDFSLQFFQDLPTSVNKLYFHNVESLRPHLLDVFADPCVKAADLIALVEPRTLSTDVFNFPDYEVVHRSDCRGNLRRKRLLRLRNSEGALVLEKSKFQMIPLNAYTEYALIDTYFNNLNVVLLST